MTADRTVRLFGDGSGEFAAPAQGPAALESTGLTKRYRGTWALRDCSLSVPAAGWSRSSDRTARASPHSCTWPSV
ncbi:hypothetical protein ACFQX6_16195 [Streptosporangium lutulentum]